MLSMGQLDDLGYEFHVKRGIMKVIKGALMVMNKEDCCKFVHAEWEDMSRGVDFCCKLWRIINNEVAL